MEGLSEEDRLKALDSLAVAEDAAANDDEGIPSNPFGTAFGAAAAAPLRKAAAGMGEPQAPAQEPAPEVEPASEPEKPEPEAADYDEHDYLAGVDALSEPSAVADFKAAGDAAMARGGQMPSATSVNGVARPSVDSERLRMLDAIASGDDEGRLRAAFDEDRRNAAQDRLSEALVGMARGAPVTFTTQMPSRAAEESALNARKDKQTALRMQLLRGQGKSGVPEWYYKSLVDDRSRSNDLRELELKQRALEREAARGDKDAERELKMLDLELRKRKLSVWEKYLGSKKKGSLTPSQAAEANVVPYGGSELVPRAGRVPTKDDRKKVQEISGLYSGAFSAMDELSAAIGRFAKDPSPANKAMLDSMVQPTATAMNAALGQGAMSESEGRLIKGALGADIFSETGMRAFIDKVMGDDAAAVNALSQKLAAARKATEATAMGKIKAYGYELKSGGGTATPKDGPAAANTEKRIRVKDKETGQTGTVLESEFNPEDYERIDG